MASDTGGRLAAARAQLPRVRRAGWNIADQALSALTNVVLSFVVARNVSAAGFGAFSVAFLLFSLMIGVERSLVGSPLSIRHSHESGTARRVVARDAFGTVLSLAVLGSAGALVGSRFTSGELTSTLLALALVLPALLFQDTCRMAFFAWARPERATLNDAIWAVAQFSAIAVVVAAGIRSTWVMVLCWGFGALVAAGVGLAQLHALPRFGGVVAWVRRHKDLVGYLLAEYLMGVGAFQVGLLLIGGALGVSNLGALRGAQVLIGPIGVVSTAVSTFGIPEVSRRGSLPRHTMRLAAAASGLLVTVTLLYGGLLLLIPDQLGTAMLGDTWSGARSVLLPVALGSAMAGLKLGPVVFIYGMGLARKSIRLVALLAVLAVAFMAVGARAGDAAGLAWGMAAAQAVVGPLWFLQLAAVVRRPPPPPSAETAETAEALERLEGA